jgi:signal transduction histidine kinase
MVRPTLLRPGNQCTHWLGGRAWLIFLGWIAVTSCAYSVAHVTGPHWLNSGPVFNVIGLSAVGAILVGARRNARARRLPWYLFALAQALFVAGDVLAYNYARFFGKTLPFPSIADAFYLAVYLPLIAGLLLLIRERRRGRDQESLIDALTVTIAAAALSWTYLMSPYAHAALGLPTKLVSIGYPLMDVLVLGVLVRLMVTSGRQAIGFVLLVLGFAAVLITDAIYGWLLLNGGYQTGGLLDIGWAAFYGFLGAAALHPSTQRLFERRAEQEVLLTGRRVGLLGAAALTAPALMVVRRALGQSLDVELLAVASAALFALVLMRMTALMRRHADAVRREAQRTAELAAAERSAKAKDDFVSQVSHELRTPLTSIRGYLELLLDDADDVSAADRERYLAIVDRNSVRLLSLVEDLLFVATMADGGFALDESEFDLAELLAEAVEAARPVADKRRIKLRDQSQSELLLLGDRDRLTQVIDNLLSNALKFTPEGGEVTVDSVRSNGNVRLVVADTGVGMRPDEIGHLFERFYRTDAATAQAIQGSGLGLSISKTIVEAHGGTITAASQLGVGTSMTIELPQQLLVS